MDAAAGGTSRRLRARVIALSPRSVSHKRLQPQHCRPRRRDKIIICRSNSSVAARSGISRQRRLTVRRRRTARRRLTTSYSDDSYGRSPRRRIAADTGRNRTRAVWKGRPSAGPVSASGSWPMSPHRSNATLGGSGTRTGAPDPFARHSPRVVGLAKRHDRRGDHFDRRWAGAVGAPLRDHRRALRKAVKSMVCVPTRTLPLQGFLRAAA
jgi:hypothetical protein